MEKLRKLFSLFLIAIYLFASPATVVFAENLDDIEGDTGDVVANDTVSVGKLGQPGDIKVTKSVKETDELGKYTVTFDIEGTPAEQTENHPIYAVVVFDTSGSMICDSTQRNEAERGYAYLYNDYKSWDFLDSNYNSVAKSSTYTAADNTEILCAQTHRSWSFFGEYNWVEPKHETLIKNKWESAVQGAIDFSNTLKQAVGNDANFSLVTFASEANSATSFTNNTFTNTNFSHPVGGTNLAAALNNANSALTSAPSNAKKVILVISDGQPDSTDDAENAANNIAEDVEIYAIGYNTTTDTQNFLKNKIASKEDNYTNADPETVSAKMKELAEEVKNLAAGTEVELTDKLTGNFSFNKDNFTTDKEISFDLQDIASNKDTLKQSVSFDIYIDKSLPTGLYDSNDISNGGVKLTYTDPNGEEKELVFEQSPTILWRQPTYTVNYYKDNIADENKLGESITKDGIVDKTITLSESELLKELPEGYKLQDGQEDSIIITEDSSKNVLNVVYVKDTFKYTVNYHYQKLNSEEFEEENDGENHTALFEEVIDENTIKEYEQAGTKDGFTYNNTVNKPLTISSNEQENVIDIYYVRGEYNYCIKYYKDIVDDNNEIGENKNKATFEQLVSITDEEKNAKILPGYRFSSSTPDTIKISTDENKNIFKVLYVKDDFEYTVNYYKDNISEENKLGDGIVDTAEYDSTVTLTEKQLNKELPEGYKLQDGQEDSIIITEDSSKNVLNVVYVKRDDLSYKVQYYYDGIIDESLTEVYSNQLFESTINEYTDKVKDGYKFSEVKNLPLVVGINEEENIIEVYYVKKAENNSDKTKAIEIPKTGSYKKNQKSFSLLISLFYSAITIFIGKKILLHNN